jgi:predicted NAD-dependent protein-ADP-ribosyltransferase YbiA (DUF1768 family)
LAQASVAKKGFGTSDTKFGTKNSPNDMRNEDNATCATNAIETFESIEISCFPDYNTPDNPVVISLKTWLTSTKYRQAVEQIRAESDKSRRDLLKARLPAVTISGIFTRRDSKSLVKHSGLIAIDIDQKENIHIGNYSQLKEQICKISNVAYCGLSASGTGYFVIIPIAYPDKHLQHFMALERAFKKLGIVIDHKCKNVDRLRGYSFDPEPYFNAGAKMFTSMYEQPRPARVEYKNIADDDMGKVESCLNQLSKDITGDYGTWFEIGCSLANAFGEAGRQYFHQVSRFYEKYTYTETDRQFDHCLKGYGKISIATLFYHFKLAGIEPGQQSKPDSKGTTPLQIQPRYGQRLGTQNGYSQEPYTEVLRDGRKIVMHPAGFPIDWSISMLSPIERICTKHPHVRELVKRFELEPI